MADDKSLSPAPQAVESEATTAAPSLREPSDVHLTSPEKQDQHSLTPQRKSSDGDLEKQPPAATEEKPPRDISGWRWGLVVLAILSSTFLFALDNTIVADIQPAIVLHFNDISNLTWLAVSFLLGAASTNLIWGKIFGQFNAKWMYIICVVLFEVGSAVCGAAPTMDALIIGRAICGVGGSGMYVGVMTLLAATTSIQERPMYIGGTGLTWGLGTVLGPIVGGGFSDSSAGWRWAFYINLVIGGLFAPVYLWMLPSIDPRPGVSIKARTREMDWLGTILVAGAFISGVMAISFGGIQYPWNSGRIIGLFVTSGVLFIILSLQQVYTIATTVTRRIFPVEFFHSRTMLILFAATAAGGTAIFVPIYIIPVFFQFTRGDSALDAGVRLLPYIALMIFAVVLNGAVLSKYGLYMPWYAVGGAFVVIGGALMNTIDTSTSVAQVYGYSILVGFGVGLFAQASFSVAQAVNDPSMAASAIGFITCAQVSGVTIALAIANSIFLNGSQDKIAAILPDAPREEIQSAISGSGGHFVQTLPREVQGRVLGAVVDSQSETYFLVVAAGALVLVLSVFMKREKLFIAAGAAA